VRVAADVATRVVKLVEGLSGGRFPVGLRAWDGSRAGTDDGPCVVLRSRRALRHVLWQPGELGLARAYVSGDLDVEGDLAEGLSRFWALGVSVRPGLADVPEILRTAARLGAIGPRPPLPAAEARLSGRLHTRRRDRAAIAHHYDLSNEFYELLLDESMAYSSAYYTHAGQGLADAQRAKLDLVCRKLGLRPGMRLLDVGCGWGSLILHAAEHYGVHATGITLSAQQRDFVAKRIADRGLHERIDVRMQDYRELTDTDGSFDAVASIEMGEHVGAEQYPTYAGILYRALRPGGPLLLQQMSRRHGAAPGGGPFIEKYIAGDMHMRPVSQTLRYLEFAGFEVRDVEAMREHYVRTARHWVETLESNWDAFAALLGEEVARVWRLYLVGGAASFEAGRMGVDQVLCVKPTAAGVSRVAPTRAWMRR
jgi:cyclopropane-fatty-acyl-phospholipid synthase